MAVPLNLPPVQGPPLIPIQFTPRIYSAFDATTGILTVGAKQYNVSIGSTGYNSLEQNTQQRVNEFVTQLLANEELKQTLAGTRTPAETIRTVEISTAGLNNISANVIRTNAQAGAAPERISINNNAALFAVCTRVQTLYQEWQARQQQQAQAQAQQAPPAQPPQQQLPAPAQAQQQPAVQPQQVAPAPVQPDPAAVEVADDDEEDWSDDEDDVAELPPHAIDNADHVPGAGQPIPDLPNDEEL